MGKLRLLKMKNIFGLFIFLLIGVNAQDVEKRATLVTSLLNREYSRLGPKHTFHGASQNDGRKNDPLYFQLEEKAKLNRLTKLFGMINDNDFANMKQAPTS